MKVLLHIHRDSEHTQSTGRLCLENMLSGFVGLTIEVGSQERTIVVPLRELKGAVNALLEGE